MNLEIMDLIGKRLVKGQERYGKENIASDGRDFLEEALEEALDCSVYLAALLIEIREKSNPTEYQSLGDNVI